MRVAQRGYVVCIGSIPLAESGLFASLKPFVLYGDWDWINSAKICLLFEC